MSDVHVWRYPAQLLDPSKQQAIPNLFNLDEFHKTAIFVDGPNINTSGKLSGERIDFDHLRAMFEQHSDLRHAYYYTPEYNRDNAGWPSMQKFLEYLSYNRWTVVVRPRYHAPDGRSRVYDIYPMMAAQIQHLASADKVDTILLVTNDADFSPLVHLCRNNCGTKFVHLSWTTQSEEQYTQPNRELKLAVEVTLDVAMEPVAKHLLRDYVADA